MQNTKDVADRAEMDLFRTTLEKGHKFVLCIESAALSTVICSNMEGVECARMLERFARKERRDAK